MKNSSKEFFEKMLERELERDRKRLGRELTSKEVADCELDVEQWLFDTEDECDFEN